MKAPPVRALSFSLCVLFALNAAATTPQANLETTLDALKTTKQEERDIAQKVARVATELESLKQQNDRLVSSIRALDASIAARQDEARALEQSLDAKEQALHARRDEVAALIYAMIRMQRLPRQFVMAQPGNTEELLRTASALHITYRATDDQMSNIGRELAELQSLRTSLIKKRDALAADAKELGEKHAALQSNVTERQKLQLSLQRDHAVTKARIAELSKESTSLRELVARLDKEETLFRGLGAPRAKPDAPSRDGTTFAARKGNLGYPAPGRLVNRFGDKNGVDDRYQGLVLHTAAATPVTAPHAGKAVFSGTFMDYGNMVIIQHDDTYHSVIAGLDIIEVEPGQPLQTGDLVGTMGSSADARRLYYELRKNSKAIDPTAWMGNLSTVASR